MDSSELQTSLKNIIIPSINPSKTFHNDLKIRDNEDWNSYKNKQHELKEIQAFRSYRKDMPYLSGMINNGRHPQQEQKKVNPFGLEERVYQDRYNETLQNQKGFRKRDGYFTEFASRNKILTDEYKALKQPENGHSRYISKPVIFTTLQSKNKLSHLVGLDHSQLLEERKNFSFKNSVLISSPKHAKANQIDLTFCKSDTEPDYTSPMFPSIENRGTLSKDRSPYLKDINAVSQNNSPKKRQTSFDTKDKFSTIKTQDYLNSFKINSSIGGKSSPNSTITKVTTSENPYKLNGKRLNERCQEIKNPKDFHQLTKFNTKLLSETVLADYNNRSKADPNQFIEHIGEVDYLRETNIAIHKMNSDRKFLRNHHTPQTYMASPPRKLYQDPEAIADINKFEENIIGWAKSVPNFGKQRWTYDKYWEFRLT